MLDAVSQSRCELLPAEHPTATPSDALRPALFPYADAITADQAAKTSEQAKRIVGRVILLCKSRQRSPSLQRIADGALADLAQECRQLLAGQVAGIAIPGALTENERLFDSFLHIERHGSPDALAIGIAWGMLTLVHEVSRPHRLVPAELSALSTGFFRLADPFVHGVDVHPRAEATAHPCCAVFPYADHPPFERWKNGHLMLVALADGLIYAHLNAISAIENEDWSAASIALRDASSMLTASAVSMRLAGDMGQSEYDHVRAQMSPPHVPRPLSGLFNADHRHLLAATRRLGVLLQQPAPELAWAREEYWQALKVAYGGHRWVCEQLTHHSPSIVGMSRGVQRPASTEIEGFASRTLYFAGCLKTPVRR